MLRVIRRQPADAAASLVELNGILTTNQKVFLMVKALVPYIVMAHQHHIGRISYVQPRLVLVQTTLVTTAVKTPVICRDKVAMVVVAMVAMVAVVKVETKE